MKRSRRISGLGLLQSLAVGVGLAVLELYPFPARADLTPRDLLPCRVHEDAVERLRCYDQTARARVTAMGQEVANPEVVKPAYVPTSITDLRLDADALAGKRVTVTGALQQLGEMVMLKRELFDTNAVFVDVKRVPREERRRILELCARGCTATVSGKVERVMMQPGLMAEHVVIP